MGNSKHSLLLLLLLKVLSYWNLNNLPISLKTIEPCLKVLSYWNLNILIILN